MTTADDIARWAAERRAAVGRLARAQEQRAIDAEWVSIVYLDRLIRQATLTDASAAAWGRESGRMRG